MFLIFSFCFFAVPGQPIQEPLDDLRMALTGYVENVGHVSAEEWPSRQLARKSRLRLSTSRGSAAFVEITGRP